MNVLSITRDPCQFCFILGSLGPCDKHAAQPAPVQEPSGPLCAGWDNPSDSDEVEDWGPECLHRSCHSIAIPPSHAHIPGWAS